MKDLTRKLKDTIIAFSWKKIFRPLHFKTNGRSSLLAHKILKRFRPKKRTIQFNTFDNNINNACRIEAVVSSLKSCGWANLGNLSPEFLELIDSEIVSVRRYGMVSKELYGSEHNSKRLLSADDAYEARLEYSTVDILDKPNIYEFITSGYISQIADAYLECNSMLDLFVGWDSVYTNSRSAEAINKAAQLPHVDFKHFRFLKFFLFIDIVNEVDGPFEYWSSSNLACNPIYYRDGRVDRSVLRNIYGEPEILTTSYPGSIIAVDTSAYHCDGLVSKGGFRRCLQLEFTSSIFGAEYNYSKFKVNEKNSNYLYSSKLLNQEKYKYAFYHD
jgi:hypothetical protein